MSDKYFDQILGNQTDLTTAQDKQLTKNILDAYVKELPNEMLFENQRIGIKLQMQSYLQNDSKVIMKTGDFLNMLLEIYQIKKTKFAEYLGIENANLHALIRGRRKFNSKLAIIVGEVFNIDPKIWMYIEAKNELKNVKSTFKMKRKKLNIIEISHDR